MKNLILKSSFHEKLKVLIIPMMLLTFGVGQTWAAKQRYIYCGISNNYDTYKDGSNWGFNFWGGTSEGVKSATYVADDYHDGRNYKVYRVQVYDNNNKAQFKGNDSWWVPGSGFSVTLNGTTNNAVYFSANEDGWYGQFQKSYQVESTASLTASSASVAIGTNVTLTPSLASNQDYNEIKSTSYSVTTNPGSGGSVTSTGVFSATKAGTYKVTATVTYNAKDFTGITKTATATATIEVYALYSISDNSTVIWDLCANEKNWSAVYLYKDIQGGSASNDDFTQCGSTTQYRKTYASAVSNMKVFLFRSNTSNWNDYTQTTDIYRDVSGVTLYEFDNTFTGTKLNWQVTTGAKKATSGTKVYFDNTNANWGEIWLKYGTTRFNRHTGAAATKVTGTANLYVITMPEAYYVKWYFADKYGYTNRNSIETMTSITNRIDYQTSDLASDITYIPSTGSGTPKVWTTTTLSGHTRRLTFGSHDNGNITVRYTDESGVEQTVSSASASYVDVAQTCQVIITAVPNSGYAPSTLTLGGNAITSGAQQIIRADGTIAATFVAETTHDVTVSYKYGDRTLHANNVIAVGETTPSDISSEAVDGFSFSSWSNLTSGIVNVTGNTSTDPIRIKTTADGSMTCNYTQWPCSLDINTTSGNTGYSSRVAMSYDATVKAYYKNFTTTVAKQYFRFYINSKKYAPSSDTEVVIAGTKVAAATDVTGYASDMPSVYFDDGGVGSNITIWFDYENKKAWVTEQKHTVTIQAGNHGSVSPTSVSVGNVVASGTITATADSHYHWSSWSLPNSGVTIASGSGTKSITIKATADGKTVTANFAGDVYSITYKDKGGSDFSGTQTTPPTSHTYGTATTLKIPTKTGYDFGGWFTSSDCSTGQVGTTSSATLGATDYTANIILYAKWDAKTYRVTFDATTNGGTCGTAYKDVTYGSTYGELPTATKSAQQFAGWYTTASGAGSKVESTTTVSTANAHTLFARFEATYRVQVDYKCGSTTLRPSTEVHASASIIGAEITAPDILGYNFVNWTGTNATFANANAQTTTVYASMTTTVTANYVAVPMVYFKNNLEWDSVFVTFDSYLKDWSGQQVPGNNGKPYYKMTQLGKTDVFYCEIPSEYVANNYANWKGTIAFDNKCFGDTVNHVGNMDPFWKGEFLYRGDFDPNATMFIPYNGDTEIRNEGTYYKTGCWIQYNTNYSGYKVNVWNSVNGKSGTLQRDVELRADVAGSFEFKAKGYLSSSVSAFGLKLYKDIQKNNNEKWYTNVNDAEHTITSATTSLPWHFQGAGSDENWQRCRILPEAAGDYIFTVSFATGRPMVDIEYPVTVGDFRLVYKDAATWNKTHGDTWKQISPVFKHKADRVDTASFFVSCGSSPALELQKCTAITAGVETWTKQSDVTLSSISPKGVYNFTVTQNNTGTAATAAYLGAYTGKFYVRTDASDGGWNDYKSTSNAMTYSEYSMDHGGSSGPYSYYFMRHVNNGQNIKFVVANDYSICLSDTLINDTYASEWIEREANVRFTYNHENNEIHRAYISGSSIVSDRFLVLEGDADLFDENGDPLNITGLNPNEMKFIDDQNWVYEATVRAKPNERIKLTAKFNDKVQYFYGTEGDRAEGTTYQLIGGTGSTKYKVRVVYDFKTNRLVTAWLPTDDAISGTVPIKADVMIIRYHQQAAQQVTFSGSGKLTDVKTVYGAMQFNKYRLNNQDEDDQHDLRISQYERDLFFISFPFDVKLNDVFGFGTYGKHWIIEYYDGKGRAEKGFWADSPTNWKFVTKAMKDSYTLRANEGYVLALDLDELKLTSSVWDYGVENVYLYFPSTADVEDIQSTSRTITIDQEGYYCNINRGTADGDRRVKDSYWHLLGVPSFANATNSTSSSWSGNVPNQNPDTWTSSAPYVYQWNSSTNHFTAVSSSSTTFNPMYSYLAQYAKTSIVWSNVNTKPASVVARRNTSEEQKYEFRLELLQNNEEVDHTFISLRNDDEVTAEFDFSYDLSKMLYGAFTSKSNIYTFAGAEQVAANCMPIKNETTVIPVGVTVAAEGEYIFSIPDGTSGIGVTLVDNETGWCTNLGLTDYAVTLPAGTCDERFVLEISPIEQIVTGIELINGENGDASLNGEKVTGVCKKLIDGVLYIVKDGKVFDARGARIQ